MRPNNIIFNLITISIVTLSTTASAVIKCNYIFIDRQNLRLIRLCNEVIFVSASAVRKFDPSVDPFVTFP